MFKVILYDVLSWGWQFPLNAPTILELQVTFQWMYQPHHDICAQIALLQKSLTTVTALFENMQGGGGSVKIHFTIM